MDTEIELIANLRQEIVELKETMYDMEQGHKEEVDQLAEELEQAYATLKEIKSLI